MNKKIIAAAVAGALALPLAVQADVVLEGELHGSLAVVDDGDNSEFNINDHQSEIAISGSHEIAPGLEGIFEVGTNVAFTGEGGEDGFFGSRDTYIGVQGNFGTLRYGIIDTAFEDADDELEDDNAGGSAFAVDPRPDGYSDWKAIMHSLPGVEATDGAGNITVGGSDDVFDVRASNSIEYASPRVGGFNFRVSYVGSSIEGGANDPAIEAPLKTATGLDNNDVSGWSASASYALGDFGAWAAYEQQNWDGDTAEFAGLGGTALGVTVDSPTAYNVGIQYGNAAGLRLAAVWESLDLDAETAGGADAGIERDAWYLMAAQEFGANLAYAKYAQADELDGVADTGADFWALGVQRDISDQFQVYVEYAQVSNEDNATYAFDSGGTGVGVSAPGEDVSAFSVGTIYAF